MKTYSTLILKRKKDEKEINKIFKKINGQRIKDFSVNTNADQHFTLITDKIKLKFAANDLGVWIEEFRGL